jgi:hypothetical protein
MGLRPDDMAALTPAQLVGCWDFIDENKAD